MLVNTFIHIPGIGRKKERALWNAGVLTWDDYERTFPAQATLFSTDERDDRHSILRASRRALAKGDTDYFAERLPSAEHYRIALAFPEETAFLDIETTGLSHYYDHITVIGVSLGEEYTCYIKGSESETISRFLSRAKAIVTFNGKIFDLKFIAKEFPDLRIPKAHVDLRFAGRSVGLRGGQKAIEQELDIHRNTGIEDIIGERAPLLWHDYRLGDIRAAKTLVKYNHADVEGMKFIIDAVAERLEQKEATVLANTKRHRFAQHGSKLKWATRKETAARNRIYVPEFSGRRGPQITYGDLIQDAHAHDLRVVGIDLTGSEKRATGWCLLEGSGAHTKLLHTDAELVAETEKVRPDLISIDSPLSLPRGRLSVGDDDPGRKKFGIMRECERELKRRGVNVYPSLIPSMQGLTGRGIRLAGEFRALGLPVIESYPGAAQDIMGIPRKRAGLEFLERGLEGFGLRGDFLDRKVSHDELDAVTAAAVGLFFWSGKFEALGNEDEDYLIIPDLETSPDTWRRRKIVGISGAIAAGKTTAARYLEAHGFAYGRYSLVLADLLNQRGERIDRDTLQAIGEEVHLNPGQRWLCKQLVDRILEHQSIVIDGLRFPEDHAFLVESFGPGFSHVHVSASENGRQMRYLEMGKAVEDFRKATTHHVESKVALLEPLAHARISNDNSVAAFEARIACAVGLEKSASVSVTHKI